MRTQEVQEKNERWGLVVIVAGCASWILWNDIGMLFPVMGVVGGLLALYKPS